MERVETNVLPAFPLVWFDDGYWGEVVRDFLSKENTERTLVVLPEEAVLLRYPEFKIEAEQNAGMITLSFKKDFVIDVNRDPISPRIKVVTDMKGHFVTLNDIALKQHILALEQENYNLKLRLYKSMEENNEMLEDFKGRINNFVEIKHKFSEKADRDNPVSDEDIGN